MSTLRIEAGACVWAVLPCLSTPILTMQNLNVLQSSSAFKSIPIEKAAVHGIGESVYSTNKSCFSSIRLIFFRICLWGVCPGIHSFVSTGGHFSHIAFILAKINGARGSTCCLRMRNLHSIRCSDWFFLDKQRIFANGVLNSSNSIVLV